MKQITININGQILKVEQSFRALMNFEKMTGKNAYEVNTSISDSLSIFYCMVTAANKDFKMDFDEFLSFLDSNPDVLSTFNTYVTNLAKGEPEKAVAGKKKAEKR